MGEQRAFALPDVGEGLTEAEVLRWLVRPGDLVEVNQMVVEIETAKAAVELPSPYAGVVTTLHVAAGDIVPVGTAIITIETDGGAEAAAPERQAVLVGYGVREESGATRRRRSRRSEAAAPVASSTTSTSSPPPAPASTPPAPASTGRVRAKPPVRRLARDLGVDLGSVVATGEHGDVTRADVLAAAPDARTAPVSSGKRIPVRGVHRAMAEAMVQSAFTAPHVTEWVDVDMSRSLQVLARLREEHPDTRLTPMTLVAAALVRAAVQHPMVNSTWVQEEDGTAHVHVHGQVHLGLAADTPRGLLVPVVRDAHRLGLVPLGQRIRDLVDSARAGRATPADLTGGTITLTNIGVFGIDGGTPILSPGQTAILAMGRILDRPWVADGAVVARPVMTLSLSFDHRVIDGALGSRALRSVADYLADPGIVSLLDRERN